MRLSQLYDRTLSLELDGEQKQGKAITELLAIEKMIKTHASIKFTMTLNSKSILKSIQILTELMPLKDIQLKNNWKVLTDPKAIEEVLIKWNIIHLGHERRNIIYKS